MRVLIVEDNMRLAESIRDILKHWYDCDICGDGNTGYFLLTDGGYDAAVLDLMLPGMDGITLLKKARKSGCFVPVLILTARSETEDRILGLESGADYYLTKPFETEEFSACLRAIMRRQSPIIDEDMSFDDITLSTSLHELKCGDKCIKLNSKEYELLRLLMLNRNNILSKDIIINKVWGYDSDATYNNLEAYISFLRRKLHLLSSNVTICITRKVGYYLKSR